MSKYCSFDIDVYVTAKCKKCGHEIEHEAEQHGDSLTVCVEPCKQCSIVKIDTEGKFWNRLLDEIESKYGVSMRRELELFAVTCLPGIGENNE